MPRDAEALKILAGLWADSGDRTDPDDASLSPPVDRDTGWPASFSDGTNLPRREVFNQRFRELDGAARDAMIQGVPVWSNQIDYPANEGIVQRQVGGSVGIYTNTAATGPSSTVVDPATGGQTTWTRVTGAVTDPGQVLGVTATPGDHRIDLEWNAPPDGGSPITRHDIRWKPASRANWQASDIRQGDATTDYAITGLTNGTAYDYQVRAVTAEGEGDWSAEGTATPVAGNPEQVSPLVLAAGDSSITATWGQPELNGATLARYELQWAGPGQSFSSTMRNQNVAAGTTTHTITGLQNGDQYRVRVRAVGLIGGPWSPVETATPVASVRVFTASDPDYQWDLPSSRALVIVHGAGGGGGAAAGTGSSGTLHGSDGQASSAATGGSTTVSAAGGKGGRAGVQDLNQPLPNYWPRVAEGGGDGGRNVSEEDTRPWWNGGDGNRGAVSVAIWDGLAQQQSIAIVIGSGGVGAEKVTNGPGDVAPQNGPAGWVRIVAL